MPAAQAMIATTRPGRYLHQLCRHVDELSRHPHHAVHPGRGGPEHPPPGADARVTWTDAAGVIDLGRSRCTLTADEEVLTLRAEADDAADLRRLQALLGARLERFGRREHLTVTWQPALPVLVATDGRSGAGKGRSHRRTVGLVVLGALVVALHVGLGAAAVAAPWWTSPALDVVVAVVVVKLLVSLVLGRRIVHQRRRPPGP